MHQALEQTAVEAARLAGEEVLRLWRAGFVTHSKGLRDVVTDADHAAEQRIIDLISHRYPDHAILAEERGVAGAGGTGAEFQWFIDPLDGTTNYSRLLPIFAVSLGVSQGGRPVAGAIYDPLHDWMYHGHQGGGAYRDDRRLVCSDRSQLDDLLMQVDWSRANAKRTEMLRLLAILNPEVGGLRTLGCATQAFCNVAQGTADIYLHLSFGPWDIAAGGLLIEEAGGRVTGLNGSPEWWRETACLASNGRLHAELLALIGSPAEDGVHA